MRAHLRAQGCRVIGVDLDGQKGELAKELGADLALIPGVDDVEEAVANFTGGLGADAVMITADSKDNRPIRLAEAVARERARLVLVGVAELSLTRARFGKKNCSSRSPRLQGQEVARRCMKPRALTTPSPMSAGPSGGTWRLSWI